MTRTLPLTRHLKFNNSDMIIRLPETFLQNVKNTLVMAKHDPFQKHSADDNDMQ